MIKVRQNAMQGLYADEPGALQQVDDKEPGRDELRRADRIRIENSAYEAQTECFTMFGTVMDNKPSAGSPDSPEIARATPLLDPEAATVPAAQPHAEPSAIRWIFAGPQGIHVLPRWLLYLVIAWVVFEAEGWLLVSARAEWSRLWWQMAVETAMMVAVIVPGFVMARIERRSFGTFGLPARHAFGKNFWMGAIWGIAALSVLMACLYGTGAFRLGTVALHGARIWKLAVYYAAFFLLTGFFEDFLMRGYSLWVLSRGVNFWPAAAFLSVAFGYVHGRNPGETAAGMAAAGMIGLFFCLTLRRTGDLWWAVGFHMAWDWGESYLYSVPDSGALLPGHLLNSSLQGPGWLTGGTVGPEGSCLVFVLIAGLWVVFERLHPEAKYGCSS